MTTPGEPRKLQRRAPLRYELRAAHSTPGRRIGERHTREIIGQQREVRPWSLREAQRPRGAVHESARAHGPQAYRELVFRRTPDPRDIPEHVLTLGGSQPPVDLLDSGPARRAHDDACPVVAAGNAPHGRRAQIARLIHPVALPE